MRQCVSRIYYSAWHLVSTQYTLAIVMMIISPAKLYSLWGKASYFNHVDVPQCNYDSSRFTNVVKFVWLTRFLLQSAFFKENGSKWDVWRYTLVPRTLISTQQQAKKCLVICLKTLISAYASESLQNEDNDTVHVCKWFLSL